MFLKARKDFNINLHRSFIVGDTTRDIETGKNAGCKTILVKTGKAGQDHDYNNYSASGPELQALSQARIEVLQPDPV